MKKLFLALAMTMMVGSAGMAFAASLEGNDETNATGNTKVEYEVEGSYTITIPDKVTLIEGGTTDMVVAASDVYIPFNKILNLKVYSANSWNIVDIDSYRTNAVSKFPYTLSLDGNVIENNGLILEVDAGNTQGVSKEFKLELTNKVTKAGTYEDRLTFTSELVDNLNISEVPS